MKSLKRRAAGLEGRLGRRQLFGDLGQEPRVLGQTQEVVHPVGLAPGHEILAGKARIRAQHDPGSGPARADPRHDALDFLPGPGGAIDVGAPELGRQQVLAAEDIERQIAVAVIVAVEETALLVAVDRVVGGVEIEDDFLGRLLVRLQEQIHEERLDGLLVVTDLVITRRLPLGRVLQAVQGRLAGQGRAVRALGRQLIRQQRQHRVMAQLVVVRDILIAQRDPGNALADQCRQAMHHLALIALIAEAGRHPIEQIDRLIGVAQKQRPSIAGDRPAVKGRHNPPAIKAFK